jgi:hypothetical protein
LSYTASLPFVAASPSAPLFVLATAYTNGTLHLYANGALAGGGVLLNGTSSSGVLLPVGVSTLAVVSSLDGSYIILITRAAPDVTSLGVVYNVNAQQFNVPFTSPMAFVPGVLANALLAPYVASSVAVLAVFSTPNTCSTWVDGVELDQDPTEDVNGTDFSLAVGTNIVVLQSILDGNVSAGGARITAGVHPCSSGWHAREDTPNTQRSLHTILHYCVLIECRLSSASHDDAFSSCVCARGGVSLRRGSTPSTSRECRRSC